MNGFRIHCDSQDFPGPIEMPTLPLLSRYWLAWTQGGPFSITDQSNFKELSAEISLLLVDVPEFRNTDAHLFRPGVFPQFAEFLVIDEWTYLFALEGPAEFAKTNALKLEKCLQEGWLSSSFFEAVETSTLGFFMYVDGFWEIYLRDQSSRTNLLAQGFVEIHSEHWIHDGQLRH